ncbi:MAG: hypothetical protein CM15mP58_23260 [Burkholderiaceae bacterium]|nr:MAG: hypothetical protein CM15mP58_23260 [Burkholderiaceae bacterium]
MISDNVFVATVYIGEVKQALDSSQINRETFDLLAVAINTGTNIPSVATPNESSCISIFINFRTSACNKFIICKNGLDGSSIYHNYVNNRIASCDLFALDARPSIR